MANSFREIRPTSIPGCFLIKPFIRRDQRGRFVKIFHAASFSQLHLETGFTESYYSVSCHNALRGMHFQRPPADHAKLVYCIQGEIFDAVVDLRSNSPTFKKYETFHLSAQNADILYLCSGVAHGFLTLSEQATTVYSVTSEHSPEHDDGVRWDTCGISWPSEEPLVSNRDSQFISLLDLDRIF